MGNTPLHCAAYRAHKHCALKLLKNGADPKMRNKNGEYQMKVHKVLRGDRNFTASISYVTYHSMFWENLMVLYKLCITDKGSPTLTKLQET